MGRYSGGYTIIEVMVVIAITGILFASAILVFQGAQGSNGFSQAMQDINSKFQNYATEISAGSYAGSDQYSCEASTGTPVIKSGGATATNQCVFLGRVFQAQPNTGQSDTINGYAIVGTRDVFNGSNDTNQVANTIDSAKPTLAAISGTPVMVENYTLQEGAQLTSSKVGGTEYDAVGLFNNLQATSSSSGSAANNLLIKPYRCSGGSCSTAASLANCVNGITGGCNTLALTNQWVMCFKGGNNQTAQLQINNSSTGLTTKLIFTSCT